MKPKSLLLPLLVALSLIPSCRSADKHQGDSSAVQATEDGEQAAAGGAEALVPPGKTKPAAKLAGPDCTKKPTARACCEALTPACNQCRDEEKAEQDAWRTACLKPAAVPKDCAAAPPVADCCSDATDACRECREAALNQLLAWKAKCADLEAASCDHQPPQSICCQAMIPSCEACRDRNERVQEDWQRRCGK